MLKFLVALALVVSSVECAAACTPAAGAQPACHHHKQAPANQKACSQELVPATIVQASHADLNFSLQVALAAPIMEAPVLFPGSKVVEQSPPGGGVPPRIALRI
jgi:hypothetical protein